MTRFMAIYDATKNEFSYREMPIGYQPPPGVRLWSEEEASRKSKITGAKIVRIGK